MKPCWNKLVASLIVLALFFNMVQLVSSDAHSHPKLDPTSLLGSLEKTKTGSVVAELFTKSNVMLAQRAFYIFVVGYIINTVAEDIENNFSKHILLNPDLKNPAALNLLRYFIGLLYPVYILAIVVTGFYIIFIPGSPVGRFRAKSLLGKLIISMVLVSISPELMGWLLLLTEESTREIIGDDENIRAYVRIAANEFSSMIKTIRNLIILGNAPNLLWAGAGTLSSVLGILKGSAHGFLGNAGHFMHAIEIFEIETVWTVPLLMLMVLVIIGVYGLLAIRYFMVLLWAMLLPFTIFLSSFEFTRGFGKTMLEQTLLWSSLQVFYGITIVVIAVGITIVPSSMYESYGIGIYKGDVIGLGSVMESLDIAGEPFFVSIFTWSSMFMLFLGPILMFTFFQKLLPP